MQKLTSPPTESANTKTLIPTAILAATLLLVPAIGMPSQLVLQDTLKSAVLVIGLLIATLAFFLHGRQKTTSLAWHGVIWLPLILMLYAVGSMFWSHTYLAGAAAIRWGVLALLVALGINILKDRQNLYVLLWGVHLGAFVASLWVALQFWFSMEIFMQYARPASTFSNRNIFSEYVVTILPLSLWLLATARNSRWLILQAASVVFIILALMMTGTRSALLTLLLLCIVFTVIGIRYYHQPNFRHWSLTNRGLVIIVFFAGIGGLGSIPANDPQMLVPNVGATALERSFFRATSVAKSTEYTKGGSVHARSGLWKSTLRMLIANPVTGVGAGAWEVYIPMYEPAGQLDEPDYYAHNEYLQLLSEYGILIGSLFFASLFAYLLTSTGKTWYLKDSDEGPLRAFTLASLLALLLVSLVGFPLHFVTAALLALGLAVLGASDVRLNIQQPLFVTHVSWRPVYSRIALCLTLIATFFAVYISWQAIQAERKIMTAVAHSISLAKPPATATLTPAERKVIILQNIREGIAINPHYRMLTSLVPDNLSATGDWANSVWIWESLVVSRPHVAALWMNLTIGYGNLNQFDKAQQALLQVQRLEPDSPLTHSLEINLLARAGQSEKAIELLNHYYDNGMYNYDMVQTGYGLGHNLERWPLAIRSLELRNARWPKQAGDGYFRLGMIYHNPKVNDPERAQAAFKAGLAVVPVNERGAFCRQVPDQYRNAIGCGI